MSSTINPVITDAGLAAAIAADGAGISLQITHVALGAGSYTPTGLETALVDRRETVTISSGSVGVGGSFNLSVLFGANTGAAYEAKEIGFYAGNPASGGTLFAVHSSATSIVYRSTLDFLAQFALTLAAVPTGSVSVLIDPAAAILHALIEEHEEAVDPHPQYTPEAAFDALKARLDARIGTLFYHAAATAPASALKCNGAAVSRTTYAALFAVIGTIYGAGDGSTTFNLPELRGEFIRGLDDGRGVDAGRGIGTAQGDAIRNIVGTLSGGGNMTFDAGTGALRPATTTSATGAAGLIANGLTDDFTFDASRVVPTASENRPRNVAALACIWFA
jgi:microcystin-dependent protein